MCADADANVAEIAGLIGEPARAAVLMALIDGRALAASTLAQEAGVARSTISGHLGRLTDAGLVDVEASGRNRYYRLASGEVAEALESLARLAPPKPVRSLRQATRARCDARAAATTTLRAGSGWPSPTRCSSAATWCPSAPAATPPIRFSDRVVRTHFT